MEVVRDSIRRVGVSKLDSLKTSDSKDALKSSIDLNEERMLNLGGARSPN